VSRTDDLQLARHSSRHRSSCGAGPVAQREGEVAAVGSGPVTASYTYDCSQMGPDGSNFIADMETVTSGLDYQSIANDLGTGGSSTTTLYPTAAGSQYYVAVIAGGCTWSLTLTQQG
jgi:hypothetical protein